MSTPHAHAPKPARRAARLGDRAGSAGFTIVEAGVTCAVVGSLLAVAVPSFVRELHASRFVEPVDGVRTIAAHAVEYARERPVASAFPASAPMTPSAPPRGVSAVDPAGAWDHPTWRALGFAPALDGVPHAFAFAFDSHLAPTLATFVAHAHGDLDGDGIVSTFEMRGEATAEAPAAAAAALAPGMYVDSEVE